MMRDMGDMDQLENLLRGATSPGALAEVDIDRARDLLGDQAADSLEKMAELTKMLEQQGLIENKEGRFELTPRGIRRIGANALNDLFKKLDDDKLAEHEMQKSGAGHEREYDTKPYEFGDPFNLNIERTVRNAVRRGGGTPVQLTPDDFEVERTEQMVRSSTVLMLDLSLSMPMRDNFLPAKKVAMALHSLISSSFPRDYLGIVGFSEVARELKAEQLPEVSWDFVYGTNMQHGFQIARRLLGRQSGTKQIIMITDGEPTAHITPSGDVFFNYPPVRETVDATLARGRQVHPRRHPHQHVHARPHPAPQALHREADRDEPGPGLLHHPRDARRLRPRGLHRGEAQAAPGPPRQLNPAPGGGSTGPVGSPNAHRDDAPRGRLRRCRTPQEPVSSPQHGEHGQRKIVRTLRFHLRWRESVAMITLL